MVLPTPFDRLLQEVGQQATREPAAAFARLDELYGKSLLATDVLRLGALAVHLGAAGLGRFADTEAFQRKLLAHPVIGADAATQRSLKRGLAVVLRCAGRTGEAELLAIEAATADDERCRLAVLSAQTLAARGRFADALPYVQAAGPLLRALPAGEEIVGQAGQIAANLARVAEGQLRQAQELIHAATVLMEASSAQAPWQVRHSALYHRGRAHLLTGDPTRALAVVQDLMALEDSHEAGTVERFFTASLACRAQAVRGQRKITAMALEACQDYARRVGDDPSVQKTLGELETFVRTSA